MKLSSEKEVSCKVVRQARKGVLQKGVFESRGVQYAQVIPEQNKPSVKCLQS